MMTAEHIHVEEIELALLLEGLYKLYGCDFRGLSQRLLYRKIKHFCQIENLPSISALQDKIFRDKDCLASLSQFMTVAPSAMFRDPGFYLSIREKAQLFSDLPLIRIWQIGCSTGQEAYSLAIVLEEEGLYDRCRIYATDPNMLALKQARAGLFPLSAMRLYTDNYMRAGGNRGFSEYYNANPEGAIMNSAIRKNITFGLHDLSTDSSFNEFHLIVVRDVLVHLDEDLRERALALLHESLTPEGILGLGRWDTLQNSKLEPFYEELDPSHKLYKRRAHDEMAFQ